MPVKISLSRVLYSLFYLLLLAYQTSVLGSETYFAAPYVQGFLAIKIESPMVNIIKNENPPKLAPKETLKILVWNIYKGELLGEKKLPFSLQDYDFTMIQEDTKENLLAQQKKPGWNYFLPTFTYGKVTTGLSIYSKYEATASQGFHTSYSEPFIITPKGVLITDFGTLRLINVHSLNFVPFEEWRYELLKVFKHIEEKEWIVLAGDFNTWSDERMELLKKLCLESGLKEIVFKGKVKKTEILGFPLDHVFVKGFTLRDAQIIPMDKFSDHHALEVTIQKSN